MCPEHADWKGLVRCSHFGGASVFLIQHQKTLSSLDATRPPLWRAGECRVIYREQPDVMDQGWMAWNEETWDRGSHDEAEQVFNAWNARMLNGDSPKGREWDWDGQTPEMKEPMWG